MLDETAVVVAGDDGPHTTQRHGFTDGLTLFQSSAKKLVDPQVFARRRRPRRQVGTTLDVMGDADDGDIVAGKRVLDAAHVGYSQFLGLVTIQLPQIVVDRVVVVGDRDDPSAGVTDESGNEIQLVAVTTEAEQQYAEGFGHHVEKKSPGSPRGEPGVVSAGGSITCA